MNHLKNSKELMLYGISAFLGLFIFTWGIGSLINTDYFLLAVTGYFLMPLTAFVAYEYKTGEKPSPVLLLAGYLFNGFAFMYGLFLYIIERFRN